MTGETTASLKSATQSPSPSHLPTWVDSGFSVARRKVGETETGLLGVRTQTPEFHPHFLKAASSLKGLHPRGLAQHCDTGQLAGGGGRAPEDSEESSGDSWISQREGCEP